VRAEESLSAGLAEASIPAEPELRAILAASSVAIIGCGGLGSNIASMLLRSGVLAMTLIDFDVIEESNLNRQLFFRDQIGMPKVMALSETLMRIDPRVSLTLRQEILTADNFEALVGKPDVLVEAVDSAETKALIIDTWARKMPAIPLVAASGLAGCASANCIATEELAENCWIVGDHVADVREGHPLLSSRVTVAAAHQAHAAIRLLLGLRAA